MLLVLLFCQPKRALLLGLGGGSVLTALHHARPDIHITAVELRQAVIDIARQFFYLPSSKRIQILNADANNVLLDNDLRKVDIIFADLYNAGGVDDIQLQHIFFEQCAAQLKPEGWLVLNYWCEHEQDDLLIDALKEYFQDIRTVMTASKNWVVLAGKTPNYTSIRELKEQAIKWEAKLGFSLLRWLNRLR